MNLSRKIIYGYAIALGFSFCGSLAGLLLGNSIHQQALEKSQTVSQERRFLSKLQLDILHNRPAKQLSPYLNDPDAFQRESDKFLDRIDRILILLETDRASGKKSTIKGLQTQLSEYESFVREFRSEAQLLLAQITPLTRSPDTLTQAELLLLRLVKNKGFVRFIEFPDRLLPFSQMLDQREKEADIALTQAKLIRIEIYVAGLLFSVAIATIFCIKVSQALDLEQAKSKQILENQLIELKQSAEALQTSESHQRAIVSAIPDLLMRINREGIYLEFINNQTFAVVGSLPEIVGKHVNESLPKTVAQRRMEHIHSALETNSIQKYEQEILIDGKLQIEEVRIVPYAEGEVLALVRDITEQQIALRDRHLAEISLQKSELTKRIIMESMPDLVIQMDLDGRYLSITGGASVRVKRPFKQSTEFTINDFESSHLAEQRLYYANKAVESGEMQIYEQEIEIEGDRRIEEVRLARLNDREVLTIIRDITDQKQFEQQLQELNQSLEQKVQDRTVLLQLANEELLRATRLKDEFLANMSHELRTPLNAILGMTEGLQEQVYGNINERQLKCLKTVERSGSHLLELINDILDLAKIESGQITLDYTPTSIDQLCQSSLSFVKQQALKKQIQLHVIIPPHLPTIQLDERRIRQVLINLLNNAVKFTPDGGHVYLDTERIEQVLAHLLSNAVKFSPEASLVKLDVSILSDRDANNDNNHSKKHHNWLKLTVTDKGIGIAPEDLPRIFQPFTQVDGTLNRQYEGTGIGLAIVKQIVELHDGRVIVESNLGIGSVFSIELPIRFEH